MEFNLEDVWHNKCVVANKISNPQNAQLKDPICTELHNSNPQFFIDCIFPENNIQIECENTGVINDNVSHKKVLELDANVNALNKIDPVYEIDLKAAQLENLVLNLSQSSLDLVQHGIIKQKLLETYDNALSRLNNMIKIIKAEQLLITNELSEIPLESLD